MKTNKFELDNIMSITMLNSELEVEQASSLISKFKWMQKENETLKPLRKHLVSLIEEYENEHWSNVDEITDEQVEKSDNAEWFIENHNLFTQRRKEIIRASLKEHGYWWDLHSTNYKDCLTRMKREAEEYIEQRTFKE